MGLMLVQIVLGTQVREAIDEISAALNYTMRDTWIEKIGLNFYIHRSFSLLILALHIYLLYILKKNVQMQSRLTVWTNALVILIVAEIGSGAVMAYFAIPAFMQPLHLLLGALIIGVQFLTLLIINYQRVFKSQIEEVPVLV
jgi:cytochrome c oxidase assembly protein subunit 15